MAPIFVIGSGRCGSSLLHELMCRHQHTSFFSNLDNMLSPLHPPRWMNQLLYQHIPQRFTRKGRIRFAPSEAFRLISREVSPIYADSSRNLTSADVTPWIAKRMQHLFHQRWNEQGIITHKYTGWSRMSFFREIFPDCRFIHVVRDGRAVVNSWLQMPWWNGYRGPEQWHWGAIPAAYEQEWLQGDRSYVLLAGILWKILMDEFRLDIQRIASSEHILEVRYEDFLSEPREIMQQILNFSDLTWDKSFEQQFSRWKINPERGNAYLRDLNTTQIEVLNRSLALHLERFSYD